MNKKIIYIGSLIKGGTCGHRMKALERLGNQVMGIEEYPKVSIILNFVNRISNYFFKKLFDFGGVNNELIKMLYEKKIDIVWIDKGLIIKKNTLIKIKKRFPDIKLIHYSPDDMLNSDNQTIDYLSSIPFYDHHITTKSYNVSELKTLCAHSVIFVNNAFEPTVHKRLKLSKEDESYYSAEVAFIGSFEQDRYEKMLFLAKNGIKVRIWGKTWKKVKNMHPNLEIIPKDCWQDEYAKVINATKINLCFLRKVNRDLQTTRSIEIPACGGFMLAERTNEHLKLFEENKEAAFFSSKEELLEKTKYYLSNKEQIDKISQNAKIKCDKLYSNDIIIREGLKKIL